jgi:hypothetical protein
VTAGWPLTSISVLAPVTRGREAELRDHLRSLPRDEKSPFARLESIHLARLVLVGGPNELPGRSGKPLARRHLLFSVVANRPPEAFFEDLRRTCGADADRIWGCCNGYRCSGAATEFIDYMEIHRLPAQQTYFAFPDATVSKIQSALALRKQHARFAIWAQGATPVDLLTRFRSWDGSA